jgi:hypothetical protein
MPPKGSGDAAYTLAVQLALSGVNTRQAWLDAGKPGDDEVSALSNIRKRVARTPL